MNKKGKVLKFESYERQNNDLKEEMMKKAKNI